MERKAVLLGLFSKPEKEFAPEVKKVLTLTEQYDSANVLANNGVFDKLTPEEFPGITKDSLTKLRFVAYQNQITTLNLIAKFTDSERIRASVKIETEALKILRDEEFEKNYSKILNNPPTKPTNEKQIMPVIPTGPSHTGQYL